MSLIRELLAETESSADPGVLVNIFRGMHGQGDVGTTIVQQVRQNRKPSDSSTLDSAYFNRGIELKLGIPDIRKTGVFGSTSKQDATMYTQRGHTDKDGNFIKYVVAQLMLPPSTKVVYNPSISDSLDVFDINIGPDPMVALVDTVAELTNQTQQQSWAAVRQFDTDPSHYLNLTAVEFWKHILTTLQVPAEHHPIILTQFDDYSKKMVSGYRVDNATNMPDNSTIECIIPNIRSYTCVITSVET